MVEINNNRKESDKRQRRRRNLRMRTSLMTEIRWMQEPMRTTMKKCEDDENNKGKGKLERKRVERKGISNIGL